MKRYIPFLLSIFLLPLFTFAEISAGIPSGGIWFSKEPFFAGESITVSAVVFNATQKDITGNLELIDKETVLQKKEVVLSPGNSKVVEFNVLVPEGKHVFSIRVSGGDFSLKNGDPLDLKAKSISGSYSIETNKVVRDALKDTDSDGFADISDSDIDGDSLTNEKEKKIGTNQSNPDTDGDGILDGVDKDPLKFNSLPGDTLPIKATDTKKVTDKIEKIVPSSVISPVLNVATPIIGTMESIRVNEANRNNIRISNSIDDIIEKVGTSKVLGSNVEATSSKVDSIKSPTGKPSGFQVFKSGLSSDSFAKTPFGYVKLFALVVYQFILSHTIIFYILLIIILLRILIAVKRKIFNKSD